MTTILMSSAKMLCSIPVDGLRKTINQSTILFAERDDTLYERLNNEAIFYAIYMYDDYFSCLQVETDICMLNQKSQINQIITLSEGDILRAAKLREQFGISGQDINEAMLFRDKLKMKHYASQFGIAVAMPTNYQNFNANTAAFPVIVKPNSGRGSYQTYKINNKSDLNDINIIQQENYIVEPFIQGDIYHIDGIFSSGKAVLVSPAKYHSSCLDFVNGDSLGSYTLMANHSHFHPLRAFAKYLLEVVFPMPIHSLFHIEVFVGHKGEVTLCEIACRLGGNDLVKEIEIAYGVDVNLAFLSCYFNNKPQGEFTDTPKYCAGRYLIPPQKATLTKKFAPPNLPEIINFSSSARIGQRYNGMEMSNNELVKIILKASNEANMLSSFAKLSVWQQTNITWEY